MRFSKTIQRAFAAASIAFMGAGACLLLWPDRPLATICTLLGAVSVFYGGMKLLGYFAEDLYQLAFQFDLAAGLLTILVGCLLLLRPRPAVLPVAVGAFILVDSILRFQTAIDAKRFGMEKWWALMAAAALGSVLGAALLLTIFEEPQAMTRLLGLTLLIDGGENLLACLYAVKVPRQAGPEE